MPLALKSLQPNHAVSALPAVNVRATWEHFLSQVFWCCLQIFLFLQRFALYCRTANNLQSVGRDDFYEMSGAMDEMGSSRVWIGGGVEECFHSLWYEVLRLFIIARSMAFLLNQFSVQISSRVFKMIDSKIDLKKNYIALNQVIKL